MDSSIVIDSIKVAWTRTRALLLTERDIGRWLKYGFIAMLGATALRGSSALNYSPPLQSPESGGGWWGGDWSGPGSAGPEAIGALVAAAEWLAANIAHLMLLAVGVVTLWIVAWVAVLYIRSVFRFIFVEAVAAPREPSIRASFSRHAGHGLSLLLWNIALGLLPFVLIVIALVPILSSAGLLASGKPLGAVVGVGGVIALMAVIFFALLLLTMGRALTEDFLVPAMYARRCGVINGWKHVAGAWEGQLGNVIFFYLLKIVLWLGVGIAGGIVAILSLVLLILPALSFGGIVTLIALAEIPAQTALVTFGMPALLALMLGAITYGYLVNVMLLPVNVFLQSYSLAFVGRLSASLRTI